MERQAPRLAVEVAMKNAIFFFIAAAILAAQSSPQPSSAHGTSYVGVMMQEIDSARAKALKLPEEAGVEITRVEPDSPAERAGLKPGDVVMQYNGERVAGIEQFSRLVRETPAGREVKMQIYRDGSPLTVSVTVAARRAPQAPYAIPPMPMTPPMELRMPDIPRSFMTWRNSALGIECETLEGQLADYFGVKRGVLVRSVSKGSVAERAGVHAGDVITRVGDAKVATPADLWSRIRMSRGKPIALAIVRDHKEITLTASLNDDDRME